MSQRKSGFERKALDAYETPEWVTQALLPHLPDRIRTVLEPAAGSGKMLRVLRTHVATAVGTDIDIGIDFLAIGDATGHDAIITNPPYELATEFITHAIHLMRPSFGLVAMLLRTDFDHAKTRDSWFGRCPMFAKKVVLTRRIKWFEDSKGSPSFNHAWFIWDWKHQGAPTLAYGPT